MKLQPGVIYKLKKGCPQYKAFKLWEAKVVSNGNLMCIIDRNGTPGNQIIETGYHRDYYEKWCIPKEKEVYCI